MKKLIRRALRAIGYDIIRCSPPPPPEVAELPADLTDADRAILGQIKGFTMTGLQRRIALIHAVRYLSRAGVEGCVVECGVWRGGSMMAAAWTLQQEGDAGRHLHLFDTFEGMTPPTELDQTADGTLAQTYLDRDVYKRGVWCVAGLDDVRQNMASTGYPSARIHFIAGPVETTLPAQAPSEPIALLRLDTDWYESTRHELVHLFPRLAEGGILILDDYGYWAGARRATDEYFASLPRPYFLHRIDDGGRLVVKR